MTTTVLLVTGPPGVGKTASTRELARTVGARSILLDTDMVTGITPFAVTPAFVRLAADNVSACIRNATAWSPSLIIVSGVMYPGGILDGLEWLFDDRRYTVVIAVLHASEERLVQRLHADDKGQDTDGRLGWTHLRENARELVRRGAHPIETDEKSVAQVAAELARLVRDAPAEPRRARRPLSPSEARELARDALANCPLLPAYRERIVEDLVRNECDGYPSHGLMRVPEYREALLRGEIAGTATPDTRSIARNVVEIDARRCPGAVVADLVVDSIAASVRDDAIGLVALRESAHLARLGPIGRRCAERGIAVAGFANTGGRGLRVLPFGGARPLFGTNPVLFAFPSDEGPIVADFSTSTWSEGRVRAALYDGAVIPAGPLLDENWHPVSDPRSLYDDPPRAYLAPMGEAETGFRGTALALWCDYVAGIVSNGGFPTRPIASFANGALFVALRPDAIGRDPAAVAADAGALVRALRSTPAAPGFAALRAPGQRSHVAEDAGVTIPLALYEELLSLKEATTP